MSMFFFKDWPASFLAVFWPRGRFSEWSIRTKLFFILMPSIMIILGVSGYVLNRFNSHYLALASSRHALTRTMAQALDLTRVLERSRDTLLMLALKTPQRESLLQFMTTRSAILGTTYVELAWIRSDPEQTLVYVQRNGQVIELNNKEAALAERPVTDVPEQARNLPHGQVWLCPLQQTTYPAISRQGLETTLRYDVFRFYTPAPAVSGEGDGLLALSLDARSLRNMMSLHSSGSSPIDGYQRFPEKRYSFLFDLQGWILFQSEGPGGESRPLSAGDAAYAGKGESGPPILPQAFRLDQSERQFWAIVDQVKAGRPGIEVGVLHFESSLPGESPYFLGYAPVRFCPAQGMASEIIGGIGYVDRSALQRAAEFRLLDVTFIVLTSSLGVLLILVFLLGRVITRPILRLTEAVRNMLESERLSLLHLPASDLESSTLKDAINELVTSLRSKDVEIRRRDEHLHSVRQREPVRFDSARSTSQSGATSRDVQKIIGTGKRMHELIERIRKTAQVDADVLIIGETGTGKELTSEAIHRLSNRADMPYISVNCGALDENLLLDALFGHVKGAFSEAKDDRKGAFLAAAGGTLLLDEIGNASAKVQQALLRTLSVRSIQPLGSDVEHPVNVRVIAATNVNLKDKVRTGEFREDLYYRLQVMTLSTPPLREHPEDIPILADHFLKEAARLMHKGDINLSRGALEKLHGHDWSGNVRELKNCVTRAVALSEWDVIYAEDIVFDEHTTPVRAPRTLPADQDSSPPTDQEPNSRHTALNERQRKVLLQLKARESITRQDYQELLGASLPVRTALYDLQDLVARGLVIKTGKGRATRYQAVKENESEA